MYKLNHDIVDSNEKIFSYEDVITEQELRDLIHNLSINSASISGSGSKLDYLMEIKDRLNQIQTVVSGHITWERIE